jgi:hypothetical protein
MILGLLILNTLLIIFVGVMVYVIGHRQFTIHKDKFK